MKKPADSPGYLDMEVNITYILHQLEELKEKLVSYADTHISLNATPHIDVEESIFQLHMVKEGLKKLDVSFFPDCSEEIAS